MVGDVVMAWETGDGYHGWFRARIRNIAPGTNGASVLTVRWRDFNPDDWPDAVYSVDYDVRRCSISSRLDNQLEPSDPRICIDKYGHWGVKRGGHLSFELNRDAKDGQFLFYLVR